MMQKATLGLIVGNRGFFPDHLCKTGRETILRVLGEEAIKAIALTPEDTRFGSIESLNDAEMCAALFKRHRDEIDGVLVTLPNFGDERAVANALRWADLNVPVLVHAFPDDFSKMSIENRRDSFCGKISLCNNLHQYGLNYSLTTLHTMDPESQGFRAELQRFVSTCRVARGLQNARIGALGTRPAAFNTVRYSEKLLEYMGITVETLDLSEAFGRMERLDDDSQTVRDKRQAIEAYVETRGIPEAALNKMARFSAVVEEWMQENRLQATALQCWTSMEEFFGVVPCTVMSMLGHNLLPSACETDVTGVVAMLALQLASGTPSALVDWNNNYGDNPDKGVFFHCSNFPKHFFAKTPKMDYQNIIAGTVGKDNTYGTIVGRLKTGPFTYCRISTDDLQGTISAYVGEGELTEDPLQTFGGYGVVHIPNFQRLMQYICENGFEHHVAINLSQTATALNEALGKYLGWEIYYHRANEV
jgi:L-fucose isomerase-like protein